MFENLTRHSGFVCNPDVVGFDIKLGGKSPVGAMFVGWAMGWGNDTGTEPMDEGGNPEGLPAAKG
jgi:hypothetical protein